MKNSSAERRPTHLASVAETGQPEALAAQEENGVVQQVQPDIYQPHHLPKSGYAGRSIPGTVPCKK